MALGLNYNTLQEYGVSPSRSYNYDSEYNNSPLDYSNAFAGMAGSRGEMGLKTNNSANNMLSGGGGSG